MFAVASGAMSQPVRPQQYYAPPGQYPPPQAQYPPAQAQYPPAQAQYPPAQAQYPPSQAQYPPAQAQYPQQAYHQPPAPQPQALRCRFCGCVPAANVTFRGHQGMIVLMRFLSLKGPFCRNCGLATFRQMTARTLVQGWYGYASFIITPITILINIVRRGTVASLPPPQPFPYGESRTPMNPEPPLMARPMALIGLFIPVGLFILLIVLIVLANL
jgi:hypothetical protein